MKENELRIGNYVYNQTGDLQDIPIGDPVCVDAESIFFAELYVSIPLTEEWLIYFNFDDFGPKYDENINKRYELDDFCIYQNLDGDWFCDNNGMIIKTVHWLQNVYFIWSEGEELKNKNL